jgi:hypothetical protein
LVTGREVARDRIVVPGNLNISGAAGDVTQSTEPPAEKPECDASDGEQ